MKLLDLAILYWLCAVKLVVRHLKLLVALLLLLTLPLAGCRYRYYSGPVGTVRFDYVEFGPGHFEAQANGNLRYYAESGTVFDAPADAQGMDRYGYGWGDQLKCKSIKMELLAGHVTQVKCKGAVWPRPELKQRNR